VKINFGVAFEAPVEWDALLDAAVEIDRATGYDYLWISDALVGNGDLDGPRLDAWTALAAIAQATSRVRLGVMVSGNAYRHPAVLAKIATTVDHISGGRLEFGIGAGWPGENRRFGIDFGTRKQRHERLAEALSVITALWSGTRATFAGEHYRLDDAPFSPLPVQKPRPPIFVGVAGSEHERLLRTAARYADKTDVNAPGLSRLSVYAREYGRDPSSIARALETPFFMHDDPAVVERAMAYARQQYSGAEGDVDNLGVFGTPAQVRDAVARMAGEGWSEIYLFQLPRVHIKSLLAFSEQVIPAFR
jgi:alkanesulfonate monooxygenase SsuD/methylene tetrahydromethanopterin reductase-like flavin-dependent oxidoreductase (luciferase family)